MDTRDVELFLAIARLKSISKTADSLFMSQSTVTTRLQRLERDLGYALFDRVPTGVELTVAGRQFLPLAERMQRLVTEMSKPESSPLPILRIMSGRAFVSTDVPSCLATFHQQSRIRLQVQMGLYDEMVEALTTGRVDFCFLGEPIYHPRVRLVEFVPDKIDLVVSKNHPFTHHFPGPQALVNEPFVAFSRETAPFRKRVMELLAKSHVYPKVSMELDSLDAIKAMVGLGVGYSLLPRRTLADAAHKGCLAIDVGLEDWVRPTLLAYPEEMAEHPITHQFLKVVRDHYASLT
ncbi:LysR family transcriptional regulator [Alicyclobacillus tolerans]|uniref:DNA-binding transcriptional LysR family regulator n=2 Tax=Alicyclobacillus tolerans TaxID=90970 RepID=A0ABT9LTP3_9BACL|nr:MULTISPECIES: LysR family transcriptional regulator [Alicyclobacillus]MDP9727628.1 DNA-binding transcriptional LysR family regulator [Alicyclobacillus tengchongensis]SHJ63832.1 transcriptional regulator, LysR family [Alicyclobacillus montanus]